MERAAQTKRHENGMEIGNAVSDKIALFRAFAPWRRKKENRVSGICRQGAKTLRCAKHLHWPKLKRCVPLRHRALAAKKNKTGLQKFPAKAKGRKDALGIAIARA